MADGRRTGKLRVLAVQSARKETMEKCARHSCALRHLRGAHAAPIKLTSVSSDEGCTGSCLALYCTDSQIPFGSNCPVSVLTIMADWASHKASSPLLNIEGRLEAHWFGPFPPNCQKMVSTHLEIDGHALQRGSWALDLKRSFKPITHGARNAISSSLLPIPSGFEKWSIIHLSGK